LLSRQENDEHCDGTGRAVQIPSRQTFEWTFAAGKDMPTAAPGLGRVKDNLAGWEAPRRIRFCSFRLGRHDAKEAAHVELKGIPVGEQAMAEVSLSFKSGKTGQACA